MRELLSSWLHLPAMRAHPSLDTQLLGPNVFLRVGDSEDWKAWRSLRELSRDYLTPWEPQWPANATSYSYYCSLLRRHWREWRSGKAFAFSIFLHTGPKPILVGGITLGDVLYAAAQRGTIGYWTGQPFTGRGFMSEAVALVCEFGFQALNLQRIEASCMPHNEASKRVLQRAGFTEEGFAKAYLQINGAREDHLLWGKNRY